MKKCNNNFIKSVYDLGFDYIKFTTAKDNDELFLAVVSLQYNNTNLRNDEYELSMYTQSYDYHNVISNKLEILKNNYPDIVSNYYVDTNNYYDERKLAVKANIGVIGKNNLLITDKTGTYHNLAIIELIGKNYDIELPNNNACYSCNSCINNCPSKCLGNDFPNNCISSLTQLKRPFTEKEIRLIGKNIWGCDICQIVCPHNKDIRYIKDEYPLINNSLSLRDIIKLSNDDFISLFKNRAHNWKGLLVIKRNAFCVAINTFNDEILDLLDEEISSNEKYNWYIETLKTIKKMR